MALPTGFHKTHRNFAARLPPNLIICSKTLLAPSVARVVVLMGRGTGTSLAQRSASIVVLMCFCIKRKATLQFVPSKPDCR